MSDNSRYSSTSTMAAPGINVANNKLPAGFILNNQAGGRSYQISSDLGQGGFGITYKGRSLNDGRTVAIKEFFPVRIAVRTQNQAVTVSGDPASFTGMLRSFMKEAQVLFNLKNLSCVVKIFDYFYANNTAYYVMEYIQGETMEKHLKANGVLDPSVWLPQYRFLMRDLAQVHALGIIHRDITPDNIIILPGGRFKLIDFGSARSFAAGNNLTVHLKEGFAPLEQYSPTGQGTYTDVYSLAATMYYSFSGKLVPSSMKRSTQDEFIPLSSLGIKLSRAQDQALSKALSIRSENRYQSMREFETAFFGADDSDFSGGSSNLSGGSKSGGSSVPGSSGGTGGRISASFSQLMAEPVFPLLSALFFAAALIFQLIL